MENFSLCLCLSVCLSVSPENPNLYLSHFADFLCCEYLDSNSCLFVLKMYLSLPQLFVFLFDVLSVAVFAIKDTFIKKIRLVLKSLSLCNKVFSSVCLSVCLYLSVSLCVEGVCVGGGGGDDGDKGGAAFNV